MELSADVQKRILKFQQDEITSTILYRKIGEKMKNPQNRRAILHMADMEQDHYDIWKSFTGRDIGPDHLKIWIYQLLFILLGQTFVLRLFEDAENFTAAEMDRIAAEIPEAREIYRQEEEHEETIMAMIDEERLRYAGDMVLGLNDALVELTGTIAGITFALASTRLVALAAIVTGAAATLSMAASNYLAKRAEQQSDAMKSSLYTGIAYLGTVVLLVLPYLLFPDKMYLAAFIVMMITVVLIIWFFNFYLSVVQSTPFWSRFKEMASISLGVTAISFLIGLAAKALLGVEL